jgi:1,4-alpha-glucan branching enzyme
MRKKKEKKSAVHVSAKGKHAKKPSAKVVSTGFRKQYLKTSPVCKVTFRLPGEAAPAARKVNLVGDFNNWNTRKTPLKRLKNGDYKVTLDLPNNNEYRFRYLIDGSRWENDWSADKYIPNQYGCDDSVVIV